MNQGLSVRIILESPPIGIDFGIQKGSGNNYETILKQRSSGKDLCFEFKILVKEKEPASFFPALLKILRISPSNPYLFSIPNV